MIVHVVVPVHLTDDDLIIADGLGLVHCGDGEPFTQEEARAYYAQDKAMIMMGYDYIGYWGHSVKEAASRHLMDIRYKDELARWEKTDRDPNRHPRPRRPTMPPGRIWPGDV